MSGILAYASHTGVQIEKIVSVYDFFGEPGDSHVILRQDYGDHSRKGTRKVTGEVVKLLACVRGEMTRRELQEALKLRAEENFRQKYLMPAIDIRQIVAAEAPVVRNALGWAEKVLYLVSGRLDLTIGGETRQIGSGDSWCVPGDTEHGAKAMEDSVAVEVFSPVREDYLP